MDIKHVNTNTINVLPTFGSSASFSSLIESSSFGDGFVSRSNKGINALQMTLNLEFKELTDLESQELISFLQSQFFYEPQIYSNEGKFTNKRIEPFRYQPFFPYKENDFTCFNYNHNKTYFNCNDVSVTLMSIANSILSSVEPAINTNAAASFSANLSFELGDNLKAFDIQNTSANNSIVISEPTILYSTLTHQVLNIFSYPHTIPPNNHAMVFVYEPFGITSMDGLSTSTNLKNSIYIHNPTSSPINPNKVQTLPTTSSDSDYLMFNFRPTNYFSLSHTPKYRVSNATDFYKKYNKYGFNPNLNNFTLEFSNRTDFEAKSILLFLESHLGYKKFGFHFNKDYNNKSFNDTTNTTPHRRKLSTFYCPEWTHTAVYKDNHKISATFIESV